MRHLRMPSLLTTVFLVATTTSGGAAQDRPTLTPADYGQWESLGGATLSPDGRWLAYGIRRVNEETELRIRPLNRDTTSVVLWGSSPAFSANSRWLAWTAGISVEERERLEEQQEQVRLGVGLRDLANGSDRDFAATSAFGFDASGEFLVLHGYAPEAPKGKGGDLRVLGLATGTEVTFGNVVEYAWSEVGSQLALALATGSDAGNGVQVYDAVSGRLRSLDASSSSYSQLAWSEGSFDLAVLRSVKAASEDGTEYQLLAWRRLDGAVQRFELYPAATGIADTLEVVRHRQPEWSDDGRLSFGLRPKQPDDEAEKDSIAATDSTAAPDSAGAAKQDDDVELPGVQIWHSSDVRTIPMQRASAGRDAQRTLLAVWDPDRNGVVQIATGLFVPRHLTAICTDVLRDIV